jgi:hypothetical protein
MKKSIDYNEIDKVAIKTTKEIQVIILRVDKNTKFEKNCKLIRI